MRLVVLYSGAMIADVVCGDEPIMVGSHEESRVRLPDTRIAAQQLLLEPQAGGAWQIRQLDANCLVRVSGRQLVDALSLAAGDEIVVLDYSIRVYPDYEDKAAHGRSAAEVAYTRAQLERFVQSKVPATAIIKRSEEPVTLSPAQVELIGRANVAASDCATIEHFMEAALRFFLGAFTASRAWIGVRRVNYGPMEYEEGRMLTGQPTDLSPLGRELRPRVLDRAQFIVIPMVSVEDRTSVLAGPLIGPDGVLGMVYLDTPDAQKRYEMRDLEVWVMLLSAFAYQLDLIFKTTARNRAAMIEGQVSVAHETQLRLTPRKLPQPDDLQLGAFREPGLEQSGDIYDVVRAPNGRIVCFVAQTIATGALPSILMSQAQAAFRYACMHQDPPHTFLQALGWNLYDGQTDHALHCCAVEIDPANGQLRYGVAGDIGAYIISNRGEERSLAPPQAAPALSLVRAPAYPLLTEQLGPEETLVLFTQGVTTARSRKHEVFGQERFLNILCDGFGQPASAALKEMLTDLRSFTEGGSQPNDITVLLAHRV